VSPRLRRACADALHVITRRGRVLRAGRAALFVLGELGWRRTALFFGFPPFLLFVEAGYYVVANHRRRFARLLRRWPPSYGPQGEPPPTGTRGALPPPWVGLESPADSVEHGQLERA
jgi:hypothetical protein